MAENKESRALLPCEQCNGTGIVEVSYFNNEVSVAHLKVLCACQQIIYRKLCGTFAEPEQNEREFVAGMSEEDRRATPPAEGLDAIVELARKAVDRVRVNSSADVGDLLQAMYDAQPPAHELDRETVARALRIASSPSRWATEHSPWEGLTDYFKDTWLGQADRFLAALADARRKV